jgi:hypothetical protein
MPLPATARAALSLVQPAPFLERFALAFFRRRAAVLPPAAVQEQVHVLDRGELAALRRIERGTIARAALAGAVSALASALAEMELQTAAFVVVTAAASGLELTFLYWDALRAVQDMARVAGVDLTDRGAMTSPQASALARAALELPNPPESYLGVNPYRRASKLGLLASSLVYKAKVGLTNFLLRALLRRLLGRSGLRALLPLVAVPVTAAWNALVVWLILRETRVRIVGRSAAEALLAAALGPAPVLRGDLAEAALRAVGATIARNQEMHPNLAFALERLHARAGRPSLQEIDDEDRFLALFARLPGDERAVVRAVLRIAIVVDGRVSRHDRALWRAASAVAGEPSDVAPLYRLRDRMLRGETAMETEAA